MIFKILLLFYSINALAINTVGTYIGHEQLENKIKHFILKENNDFDIKNYLMSLEELLGTQKGIGVKNEYLNGTPNTINYVTWQILIDQLSTQIAGHCTQSSDHFGMNTYTQNNLDHICQLKVVNLKDPKLRNFWNNFMGYKSSRNEFENWLRFIEELVNKHQINGSTLVELAIKSIWLHPHFLLKGN